MYQVPTLIWNQVAETNALTTEWGRKVFPLPAEDQEMEVAAEELRLTQETGSSKLALAYLMVMPLLWERRAIRIFKETHGENRGLPAIETVQEAVIVASKDLGLTIDQQRTLSSMLSKIPVAR